jgi:hypothetical protein
MSGTLTIDSRFQGIRGIGQGGHFAGLLAEQRSRPTRVWFRAPIPLDHPLRVDDRDSKLVVSHGETEIAHAEDATVESAPPDAVSLDQAERGRRWAVGRHFARVESCFSCGMGPESLRVHAGKVGTGPFATPFTPPLWTAGPHGTVRDRFLWAPLDCAAGWRVSLDEPRRLAVTGWLSAEVVAPVGPGTPLVVVADADGAWSGRKRMARSAIYTADGALVARAESLWISVAEPEARQ